MPCPDGVLGSLSALTNGREAGTSGCPTREEYSHPLRSEKISQ